MADASSFRHAALKDSGIALTLSGVLVVAVQHKAAAPLLLVREQPWSGFDEHAP